MDRHEQQDQHLMETLVNMIKAQGKVDTTLAHCNLITITGKNLTDTIQTIIGQVPVLDMRAHKVDEKNLRGDHIGKEVHQICFKFNHLQHLEIIGGQ